jgi:anaerobic selenocysteine-containing dehydrogenase
VAAPDLGPGPGPVRGADGTHRPRIHPLRVSVHGRYGHAVHLRAPLAAAYGSYNVISHESNCLLSRNRAFLDTYGVVPTADVLNCKYIIMPGANRFEALVTPDSMDLMTAMQNGCKLVVLDPRFTKTAAHAHEWYAIKPGTDMAFFLAMSHVLITEAPL